MSATTRQATETLKEILQQLAAKRLPPTPLHFKRLYEQVTGEPDPELLETATLIDPLTPFLHDRGTPPQLAHLIKQSQRKLDSQTFSAILDFLAAQHGHLRALLAHGLAHAIAAQVENQPELRQEAQRLAFALSDGADAQELHDGLERLFHRCHNAAQSNQALVAGMRKLLQTVALSLKSLAEDEGIAAGHIETLARVALQEPLTGSLLKEAEKALLDLTQLQDHLRHNLRDGKLELQRLIKEVISQIASDAIQLGASSDKMADIAEHAINSENLDEVRSTLLSVVAETRHVAKQMRQAHEALQQKERQIFEAQERISLLQGQLAEVSQKVKEDTLTGALNRRGLEEAAERDISLAARNQQKLCLALLDIDDFKLFNDLLGHDGGDEAITYLARTLREVLRPADSICRFGGEEFVLLLPHATLDDARKILARVQRALTKNIWLNNHQRLLTFSSGVTEWRENDTLANMITRADQLMYVAKRTGKNRVCGDGDDERPAVTESSPPLSGS